MVFLMLLLFLKYFSHTFNISIGIPLPESVADHMYRSQINPRFNKSDILQFFPDHRMSMISFLVQDPTVDKDKLMKICMVHDLAEAIVGDITPHDGVSKEEKRKLEEVCDWNVVLNYK